MFGFIDGLGLFPNGFHCICNDINYRWDNMHFGVTLRENDTILNISHKFTYYTMASLVINQDTR